MAGRSVVQERVVGGEDRGEVPLDRRNSKGGPQGAGTELGGWRGRRRSMAAAQAAASRLRYISAVDGSALSAAPPASGTTTGSPHATASATPRPYVSYGQPWTR